MRIAVLASEKGEKALHIYEFFKEGNRVEVDCLITDREDSPLKEVFAKEGIPVFTISPEEWPDGLKLTELLSSRGAEIIVVDDLESPLPDSVAEKFGPVIIYPGSVEESPSEIVALYNRLLSQVASQTPGKISKKRSENPSPEEEWADVLKVDYDEDEARARAEEINRRNEQTEQAEDPKFTPVETGVHETTEPISETETHKAPTPPPYEFGAATPPRYHEEKREPMPQTYLLWSVLATVFCCLVPGIVAIIYSSSVSSKYFAGDIEGAKRASRRAQIWIIVSIVSAIVWFSIYIPLMLLAS